MFHIIRKIIIAGLIGFTLAGVYWLVMRKEVLHPVIDLVEAWRNRGPQERKFVGELNGEVVRILAGDSFEIRGDDRRLYTCGLTGLLAPKWGRAQTAEEREQAKESRDALTRLALSNRVTLKLTFTTEVRSVLALAYLNQTNLNAAMIECGAARLEPAFIKGLPVREQYAFFRAARRAQERPAEFLHGNQGRGER